MVSQEAADQKYVLSHKNFAAPKVGSDLGFGVGFRPIHYHYVADAVPSSVDWFEIISENFMGVGGRPRRFLEMVRSNYPVVMHGVALSIGSTAPLNRHYLQKLKELVDMIQPSLVSDHLCWTTRGGHNSHDLLPMPLTEESLRHVISRVNEVQDYLGRTILLENPSAYVAFGADTVPEATFLAELCLHSGCGILLDLNNLYVNHRNLGLKPIDYLENLKPGMVGQFHLAGHTIERDAEGQEIVRIDTHDAPVCDEVWDLYALAAQRFPDVPTLIEWDDKIPEFSDLAAECQKARFIATNARGKHLLSPSTQSLPWLGDTGTARAGAYAEDILLDGIQEIFLGAITKPREANGEGLDLPILSLGTPVPRAVGVRVYTDAYYLRLRDCLSETFPTLAYVCEEEGFGALAGAYLLQYPPSHYSVKMVASKFEEFLRSDAFAKDFDFGVPHSMLADIAALEWADAELFDAPRSAAPIGVAELQKIAPESWANSTFEFIPALRLLELGCDAEAAIIAVEQDDVPAKPEASQKFYLVYRSDEQIVRESIPEFDFRILSLLTKGQTFGATCDLAASLLGTELTDGGPGPSVIEAVVKVLLAAFHKKIVIARSETGS